MRRAAILALGLTGCGHGKAAAPAPAGSAVAAVAAPNAVPLFDGATLEGWEGDPAVWAVRDGAIDGVAEKGGQLIYTKGDYDDFRLILQSRLVSESEHLGVCFWGDRLPDFKYGQCILVIPPSGGMWDYHPGKRGPPRQALPHPKFDASAWHTTEILANRRTGEVRMAVNGVEVTRYKDIDARRLKKGPIGLQIHSGASRVQYKDVKIEVNPRENRLITVKERVVSP
jgi:hypothetical protein